MVVMLLCQKFYQQTQIQTMSDLKDNIKKIRKRRKNVWIQYSEYLAESIDKSISYTEYLSDSFDKKISYSEYLKSSNDNM
jgi:hypothetical protein